mgnify:CR=1 FL=1
MVFYSDDKNKLNLIDKTYYSIIFYKGYVLWLGAPGDKVY